MLGHKHTNRDSLVDMIGYTLLKERIHEHD